MWWFQRYDAFISYSHRDSGVVKPLIDLLSVNQQRVFWDGDLKPGDRWEKVIDNAVKRSGIFVLFWCCDTSQSKEVAREIASALRLKKKIVPVKLCSAPVPHPIGEWQWIDLRSKIHHNCLALVHDDPISGAGAYTQMFGGPIPAPSGPATPSAPQPASQPVPPPQSVPRPLPTPARRPTRFLWPAIAAATVLLVVALSTLTWKVYAPSRPSVDSTETPLPPPPPSDPSKKQPPQPEPASDMWLYPTIAIAFITAAGLVALYMRKSHSGKQALDLTLHYLERMTSH
jgi:TIR domain-containing protein